MANVADLRKLNLMQLSDDCFRIVYARWMCDRTGNNDRQLFTVVYLNKTPKSRSHLNLLKIRKIGHSLNVASESDIIAMAQHIAFVQWQKLFYCVCVWFWVVLIVNWITYRQNISVDHMSYAFTCYNWKLWEKSIKCVWHILHALREKPHIGSQ